MRPLFENEQFKQVLKKIIKNEQLSFEEQAMILGCSCLLLQEYYDTSTIDYLELSYYIILQYYIQYNDYQPLLEFATNNGIFPISSYLLERSDRDAIADAFLLRYIEEYKNEKGIVLLKKQKESLESLSNTKKQYKAFIAPTSYGKSEYIIADIKNNSDNKIGIIVPSKALIWQTYSNIKKSNLSDYSILIHDTEYKNEKRFIGIFTQERATRLLQENDVYFDSLYIDEAHNLFSGDERAVLLARLIRMNTTLNHNQRITFLSPLVKETRNLKIGKVDDISQIMIDFNIRDYDIKTFGKQNKISVFNRFFNEDYFVSENEYENGFQYIFNNSDDKNFIYIDSPKKIESFAADFCSHLNDIESEELQTVSNILKKYINENYYLAKMVKKGVLVLHGKMPDFIKEYILYKFKTCSDVKYIISNSCIFEGVNFPIHALFIVNGQRLNRNSIKNLAGRINRLNEVFDGEKTRLDRLLCHIHFVWIENYSDKHLLSKKDHFSESIKDDVNNPLLDNKKESSDVDKRKKESMVKSAEDILLNDFKGFDPETVLIRNGIYRRFDNISEVISALNNQVESGSNVENIEDLLKAISSIFISNRYFKDDNKLLTRMLNKETISYYYSYIRFSYHSQFKAKINNVLRGFDDRLSTSKPNHLVYIGDSFGEADINNNKRFLYIDLGRVSRDEFVRYAVIKAKIEDDFLEYEIMPFVKTLKELGIITEDLYNIYAFGTDDVDEVDLCKLGFSSQLIAFIKDNNLMNEFTIMGGKMIPSETFLNVVEEQDDYLQFEISKFTY